MAFVRVNSSALRAIRERSGYTITQFATVIEITPSHLSNIEAGRRQAAQSVILRMAKVLKVPVTAIISDPEPVSA